MKTLKIPAFAALLLILAGCVVPVVVPTGPVTDASDHPASSKH